MNLRYTRRALADLIDIQAYIAQDRPTTALAVGQRIRRAIDGLMTFPEQGRSGRVAGTRELVIPPLPYVVAYEVGSGHVDVLAILHAARSWPNSFP